MRADALPWGEILVLWGGGGQGALLLRRDGCSAALVKPAPCAMLRFPASVVMLCIRGRQRHL